MRMIARTYGLLGFVMISINLGINLGAKAQAASCDDVPASAVETARAYYANNAQFIEFRQYSAASGSPGRKIVINDFREAGKGVMYILDAEGRCENAFPVDYGKSGGGRPKAGCESESNKTPPGMHITAENAGGAKYPYPKGMGMVSCSGQDSFARGVKVHPARGDGGEHTHGCAGLKDENYDEFLKKVRGGSLVYNYFGDDEAKGEGCPQRGGTDLKKARCEPESVSLSGASRSNPRSKTKSAAKSKSQPSGESGSSRSTPARRGGGRTVE